MPAVADIVLADAQTTPVNHTFVAIGPDSKGVWWFEDATVANAIGNWKVSVELVKPSLARPGESSLNRTNKVRLGIYMPILENTTNSTISGIAPAPTVSYVCAFKGEYLMPERSTKDFDRKTLRKFSFNLPQNTQIATIIESLQNYF